MQVSGFRFPVWTFQSRVSGFQFPVSGGGEGQMKAVGFRFPVSHFRFHISGFRLPVSRFRFGPWDPEFPLSGFRFSVLETNVQARNRSLDHLDRELHLTSQTHQSKHDIDPALNWILNCTCLVHELLTRKTGMRQVEFKIQILASQDRLGCKTLVCLGE